MAAAYERREERRPMTLGPARPTRTGSQCVFLVAIFPGPSVSASRSCNRAPRMVRHKTPVCWIGQPALCRTVKDIPRQQGTGRRPREPCSRSYIGHSNPLNQIKLFTLTCTEHTRPSPVLFRQKLSKVARLPPPNPSTISNVYGWSRLVLLGSPHPGSPVCIPEMLPLYP